MPQFGTIKRVKPRVRVLRGFNPQEPFTLSQAAPVSSLLAGGAANADGIKSGQVISLVWVSANHQYEWALGCVAGLTPYIAYEDSTDADVIEAGKLTGLSCAGQFEIATPYFTAGTYKVDVKVTFDAATGNIKVWPANTVAAGEPVIGFVSRNFGTAATLDSREDGIINLAGVNSSATSLDVVTFTTAHQGLVGIASHTTG